MSIPPYARSAVALVAAYAVALQAILLVAAGSVAGPGDFAARPICAAFGPGAHGSAPAGHERDCLAACVACCCSAPTPLGPAAAVIDAPELIRTMAVAVEVAATARRLSATGAHRSRAPPLG